MEDKIRTVTTDSGFTCEVDEEILDDFEIVEAISRVQKMKDDPAAGLDGWIALLNLVLGTEQKEKLIDHVKSIHGRAKLTVIESEVMQIIAGLGTAKKN